MRIGIRWWLVWVLVGGVLVVAVAAKIADTTDSDVSGSSALSGDSTCREYVQADSYAQQRVTQTVAQDNRLPYNPLVQANVGNRCSLFGDRTVQWAVAADNPVADNSAGRLGGTRDDDATSAATTTSTQTLPKVRAQVNLTPPQSAAAKNAMAIVQFVDVNGKQAVNAVAQGLPAMRTAEYGIWAYNGPSQAQLIGGFNQTDNKGHIVFQGSLTQDISDYREILVTRETTANPTRPGPIYLRGAIAVVP